MQRYKQATSQLVEVRSNREQTIQTTKDLVDANRQLALMNERIDAARRIAETAQKSKAAFVANVSHEFRTPLNVILGVIDMLLENPQANGESIPPRLLDDLDTIRRNSEHLAALIGDVLDLSQVESGRMTIHKERVNLSTFAA